MLALSIALLFGVPFLSPVNPPAGQEAVVADSSVGALREGTWTHFGRRNIIGAGTDTSVTLKRVVFEDQVTETGPAAGWTIRARYVYSPPDSGIRRLSAP